MADDINIKVTHIFEGLASADALGQGSPGAVTNDLIIAAETATREINNQNPDNNQNSKGIDNILLGLQNATTAMNNLAGGGAKSGRSSKEERLESAYSRAQAGLETAKGRKGVLASRQIIEAEKMGLSVAKHFDATGKLTAAFSDANKEVQEFSSKISDINRNARTGGLKSTFIAGLGVYAVNSLASAAAYGAQGLTIGSGQYNQFKVNQAAAWGGATGGLLTSLGLGLMASGVAAIPGGIVTGLGATLTAGSALYSAYAGTNVTNTGRANLIDMGTTDPRGAKLVNMLATQGSKIASQIPYYETAERFFQRFKSGGPQEAYNMARVVAQMGKETNIDMTPLLQPMSYLESKYGTGSATSFTGLFKNIGTADMTSDMQNMANLASLTSMSKSDLMNFAQSTIPLGVNYQQAATSMMLQPKVNQAVADLMLKSVVGHGVTLEGLTDDNTKQIKQFEAWEKTGAILGRDAQGKPVYYNQVLGQSIVGTSLDQSLEGVSTVNIKAFTVNMETDKERGPFISGNIKSHISFDLSKLKSLFSSHSNSSHQTSHAHGGH